MEKTFAEKLKKAKKEAGLTQQKMADLMLIPKRTIEEWERGNNIPAPYVQRFVLNELESLRKEKEKA
jgi:transcriptional regulator with XRE-family HTH domain